MMGWTSDFPILVLKNEPLQVRVFEVNNLQNSEIMGKHINLVVQKFFHPFWCFSPCLVLGFQAVNIVASQMFKCKL